MINADVIKSMPELTLAKDGGYSYCLEGRWIHSKYAPVREGERLVEEIKKLDVEKTLVIFIGSGLGYQIEAIEKKGFRNILVIERSPEIFRLFSSVYDTADLSLVVGPEDDISLVDSFFTTVQIQRFKHIKTVVLRGAYREEDYTEFEDRIERLVKVKLGDFATRLKFEENWFINIMKNIVNLKDSYPVKALFCRQKRFPVLLISAGPSLKFSIPMIEKLNPYVITIAVDTALIPLYEAGITPDFVYSLDSQVHNLSDFTMISRQYLSKVKLIYDVVVNPALPRLFPGLKFAANTAHFDCDHNGNSILIKSELVNWIESVLGVEFGDVETGGSVATSAFHFAYMMGASDIILTGQDLAYSNKVSHCVSTSHFYRISRKSNRIKTMESIFLDVLLKRNGFITEALEGETYTDFVLNNFKGWFEESSRNVKKGNKGVGFYNASYKGAVIRNFETMDSLKAGDFIDNKQKLNKNEIFSDLKLIDSRKIGTIMERLSEFENIILQLPADETIFEKLEQVSFDFLDRYFMREKMIFERYGNFEKFHVERKIYRLLKNIRGVLNVRKEDN